ncbi:hypothetical protein [Escherichia phage IMM-001]|nr:hypothetical protein [Escherichia phage IMM-001]
MDQGFFQRIGQQKHGLMDMSLTVPVLTYTKILLYSWICLAQLHASGVSLPYLMGQGVVI